MMVRSITATAPAKVILFGEHAVNRGQTALAVSVGLYSTCTLTLLTQDEATMSKESQSEIYTFHSKGQQLFSSTTTRHAILKLGQIIDTHRANSDYAEIQKIVSSDFFAPVKYVLAALGDALPPSLEISCASIIPQLAGLGSGGSTFVALAAALTRMLGQEGEPRQIAAWALRGDIVAHGGTASGLDTQTSLYGGAIRYTLDVQGEPIPHADGLTLVIGNTGIFAATSEVNARVRRWLADCPTRLHYFHEIGLLAQLAEAALCEGDWHYLGHLFNLNQLLLERIGVSCPELDTLIDASLEAGALGAKLSGSGGGGIMIALVTAATVAPVAQAITETGGTAIVVPVGVPGVIVDNVLMVDPASR